MQDRLLPSPAQVRAARALLDWSQQKLAAQSGIVRRTVASYELGNVRVTEGSIAKIADALMAAGIAFSEPGRPEGVSRRPDEP
jgi:transcriptional regulator with XRE-family HTH domain